MSLGQTEILQRPEGLRFGYWRNIGPLGTGHWSDQLPERLSACLCISWETRGSRDQELSRARI